MTNHKQASCHYVTWLSQYLMNISRLFLDCETTRLQRLRYRSLPWPNRFPCGVWRNQCFYLIECRWGNQAIPQWAASYVKPSCDLMHSLPATWAFFEIHPPPPSEFKECLAHCHPTQTIATANVGHVCFINRWHVETLHSWCLRVTWLGFGEDHVLAYLALSLRWHIALMSH